MDKEDKVRFKEQCVITAQKVFCKRKGIDIVGFVIDRVLDIDDRCMNAERFNVFFQLICFIPDNYDDSGQRFFLNLMQHADSATAVQGASVLSDSLVSHPSAMSFFEGLMERYLGDSDSPLYSDEVYTCLLRALPETPQRVWLLEQLAKNRVGSRAADILVTTADGKQVRLERIKSEQTLLIFYDPDCRRCQRLDAQLEQEPSIVQNPRLKVVRKDMNDLKGEYYVPHTPALYLLDKEKRVVLKNTNLEALLGK